MIYVGVAMETSRGLSVTTHSLEVIESINHFHHQILGSGKTSNLILDDAKNNPDNLLLQTYAAAFYLYEQTNSATALANKHLLQAEKFVPRANLREQLTYQAVKAWKNLDYESALTLFASLTALYPRDTLAAKFAEWIFYCAGQAYNGHRYLAFCERIACHNQDESHFIAMHSFAAELAGHVSEALHLAEQALLIESLTPWAQHTLAHAYLNTNRIEQGIIVVEAFRDRWDEISPLLRGHNSWHLALFYLAMRQEEQVLALFPFIFGNTPDIIFEQIYTISLLWRLDMAGFPNMEQFKKLAPYISQNSFPHATGFNTIHYLYCLARLGEENEVQNLIHSMEHYSKTLAKGHYQNLWLSVILPLCKGIHAFTMQNYQSAYDWMSPCISRRTEIGGSDAQSEIIAQTYLLCLIQCNQQKAAREFFKFNLGHYQDTALASFWFEAKVVL